MLAELRASTSWRAEIEGTLMQWGVDANLLPGANWVTLVLCLLAKVIQQGTYTKETRLVEASLQNGVLTGP